MSPARPTRQPRIEPMLARDGRTLPAGESWAFEIKWDGIRAFALTGDAAGPGTGTGAARLISRRGEDLTARYPELAGIGPALAPHSATIDGEIVALDAGGQPSFQLLQQRMGVTNPLTIARRAAETPVTFVAFDLLELDGSPLVGEPYERRRDALLSLGLAGPHWQTPRHHLGDGTALLEAAQRQGLEGVVAKRLGSPYRAGSRSGDWVKVRLRKRQDFVIGGWLAGAGGRSARLGSLLLGIWDVPADVAAAAGRGQRLVYAGAVGSGLSEATIDQLTGLLAPHARDENPFELGIGPKRAGPRWSAPELVCSVEFSEWTREDTLRQPAFKGLRDDVDPRSVLRE